MAQLYQCSVSDLVVDLPDYRHQDSAQALAPTNAPLATAETEALLADLVSGDESDSRGTLALAGRSRGATSLVQRLYELSYHELAQVIVMWMGRLTSPITRRALMSKLSAAFTVAAAAPLFDVLDPDEQTQVARVVQGVADFNEPTLRYCTEMAGTLFRQCNAIGPSLTLQSALGHRKVARSLIEAAPSDFRQQALSVYAELTRLVGWMRFNLGDYRGAQYYYEDARSAAHDAQNVELAIFTLCCMSKLAVWEGRIPTAVDQALVVQFLASQTDDPRVRADAADCAARAFAADRQSALSREALDAAHVEVARFKSDGSDSRWKHFYESGAVLWATMSNCALRLGEPDRALDAISKSLAIGDPTHMHNRSFSLLSQTEAFIQKNEIAEAGRIISEVAAHTTTYTSTRIDQRITELRSALSPWQGSKPVRELDEVLATYRRSPSRSQSL